MNPYLIELPALVSFSGGRTSGFMLRQILDAFGGKQPEGLRVAFMNTGKEREETLVFIKEVAERWGANIVWLEYDRVPDGDKWKPITRVVDFTSASRKGEPFRKAIEAKSYLPNVVARFCTAELKIRTVKRWMMSLGYEHWTSAVGIRADEPHRAKGRPDENERWVRVCPMVEAGHTVEHVMEFWKSQPFDLGLRQDEGNCDLCFLKGRKKLKRLILERPESADWWIAQEENKVGKGASATMARFNKDRTFRELRDSVYSLPLLEATCELDDEEEDCNCTD